MKYSSKLFLPYDIYERHKKVGSFIKKGESVLDVGGDLNQLSRFCHPSRIVVANLLNSLEKSDVLIKKNTLPFGNGTFDAVTAVDVLEHLEKKDRKNFIYNLIRIAKKKVVVSFPLGTQRHIEYERELLKWLKNKQQEVGYLEEHVKNGLPTVEEIEELKKGLKIKVHYSGNYFYNEILFKIFMFDPKIKLIRKFIYIAKSLFNLTTNFILYIFLSNKNYSENVIRAYLVIEK